MNIQIKSERIKVKIVDVRKQIKTSVYGLGPDHTVHWADSFVYTLSSGRKYQVWEPEDKTTTEASHYFDTLAEAEDYGCNNKGPAAWDSMTEAQREHEFAVVECDAFIRFLKRGKKGKQYYDEQLEEMREYWESQGCDLQGY